MIGLTFTLMYILKLTVGVEAYNQGQCYSWSYADAFFIKGDSLAESAVLDRMESRSFVECCVKCDVSQNCSGVAFRDGECSLINGTAAAPGFEDGDGNGDDYKVRMYPTEADGQNAFSCNGNCEECTMEILRDCKSLLEHVYVSDGVYKINPGVTFDAYCDMSSGGWTVIQRRVDDSVDFYRGWDDYVDGFGDLTGNFWAGLYKIHALTKGSDTELYVSMETFEGESVWAHYSSFSVGDAASDYTMTVSGFSGTAGDSMALHNDMKFSTFDNDHDGFSTGNCASKHKGAWWYNTCHHANPNGPYVHGEHTDNGNGINWYTFKGHFYSLKTVQLKIKRK